MFLVSLAYLLVFDSYFPSGMKMILHSYLTTSFALWSLSFYHYTVSTLAGFLQAQILVLARINSVNLQPVPPQKLDKPMSDREPPVPHLLGSPAKLLFLLSTVCQSVCVCSLYPLSGVVFSCLAYSTGDFTRCEETRNTLPKYNRKHKTNHKSIKVMIFQTPLKYFK